MSTAIFNPKEYDCWIAPVLSADSHTPRRAGGRKPRSVIQTCPDGREIAHETVEAAARAAGLSSRSIRKAAGCSHNMSAGCKWRYANKLPRT